MAICTNCKEKIEYLNYNRSKYDGGEFSIDKDGFEEYNEDVNSDLIEPELSFNCPECDKEFDFDEDEAIKFLKEKDELQEVVNEKLKLIKNENEQSNKN